MEDWPLYALAFIAGTLFGSMLMAVLLLARGPIG